MSDFDEATEPLACAECGASILDFETFCAIGDEDVLCWDCALRRGGAYDAVSDRWTVMPDASDLVRTRPMHRSHAG